VRAIAGELALAGVTLQALRDMDFLGVLQQLGVLPRPGQVPAST
jgi:hypothetical protein